MCLYVYLFLCIDSFIDSLIAGKTKENLTNRLMVQLVTLEEKLKKLAAQPFLKQFEIFSAKLVVVKQAKVEITLNRSIYVGFIIQDLSKTLIYDFHYNYMKQNYRDCYLLFTNTDSLTYQLQTVNVYEDFYADMVLSSFSGCDKESPFYNDENKKLIGKMKD